MVAPKFHGTVLNVLSYGFCFPCFRVSIQGQIILVEQRDGQLVNALRWQDVAGDVCPIPVILHSTPPDPPIRPLHRHLEYITTRLPIASEGGE